LGSSGFRSLDRHSLDPGDFRVQDRGFERLEQRQNRPRREQRAIESQRLAVVIPNAALRADGGHSRDARTFRISVEWLAAQSERGQAVDVDEKELKCSTPIGAPTRPKQSAQEKGATTSFTASAYWKFESTPLQRGVGCELRSSQARPASRASPTSLALRSLIHFDCRPTRRLVAIIDWPT
jgi:hypothetical protein